MTDPEPDQFFVGRTANRLATDAGPVYRETPADPWAVDGLAEPFNTATAFLFVLIVVGWVVRLRGRYRRHPFTVATLPILMAGAVGGTLYHATRTRRLYFLLDVIPITLLGTAGAVYLSLWLGKAYGWARTLLWAAGLLGFYLFVNAVLFRSIRADNPNLTVNLSYASLALMLLVPLAAVMVRTRFRHAGWVAGGLASFAVAWFCRLVDNTPWGDLPMGTHWLWHIFGAVTTQAVYEYFYRLEGQGRPG
jgi:hypothetical protein